MSETNILQDNSNITQEVEVAHSDAVETDVLAEEASSEPSPVQNLKYSVDDNSEAAMLCEAKDHNPNYLSIIHANEKFYEVFGISEYNLIGKSYDFLFDSLDFDYSSEDQLEYIRLVKAIKDGHTCSIVTHLQDHKSEANRLKLKIDYAPSDVINNKAHAIFIFTILPERIEPVPLIST